MAFYADLTACDYFGARGSRRLVAIGWLEGDQAYDRGAASPTFVTKLKALLAEPWQPWRFRGSHDCTLCKRRPPSGWENLFVPGEGHLYVAPALIAHYVAAHRYRPPAEFVDAVARCPAMNSLEYLAAVRRNAPSRVGTRRLRWTALGNHDPRLERRLLFEGKTGWRLAALTGCAAALRETGVTHPAITRAVASARKGAAGSSRVRAELDALRDHLLWAPDPSCPRAHPHEGQACPESFRKAATVAAVLHALAGHPVGACGSLSWARAALGPAWPRVRRSVLEAAKVVTKGTP